MEGRLSDFGGGGKGKVREDFPEEAGHGLTKTWIEEESCARRGYCTCRRWEVGKRGVKVRPLSCALLPML